MKKLLAILLCLCVTALHAANWPAWRGPTNDGVCTEKDLPVTWNTTENVAWKVALPSAGNSTPIIWDKKVFITSSVERGRKRGVMCFDRTDGKLLWQKDITYAGNEPTHKDNPFCSATPITDGERVIAHHGSAGIVAYDMDGNLLWQRNDLGELNHIWGNATSPIFHDDLVIAYCGPGLNVFLIALDKKTGKDVWKLDLPQAKAKTPDQFYGSWSTPVIRDAGGKKELILGLPKQVVALDLATQKEIWTCSGLGPLVYTNPLISGDTIVVMSGYSGPALGVRAGGSGDVTATHRLWLVDQKKDLPQRVGSGVVVGDHIYILNDPGFAQCIEMKTGKEIWREKLGGTSWSSMCHADGKLYVIDMKGESFVLQPSTEFKLLSRNPLNELTRASLAFSNGQIFIRTYQHLWCIGAKK
ncbi:MAG TPA: PQQ-binding-like beta-propeller repeat protein [Planctomycetota bacterium]|nr:PQQ-binding-like beta-propeller repeat protein [Planctomycetota bacterium]